MIDIIDTNTPLFLKNARGCDVKFSWKECEEAINRSVFLKNLVLIDPFGFKAEIKNIDNYWYTNSFDINHIVKLLNKNHSFILTQMSCYNKALNYFCDRVDQRFNSASDVHIYGGIDGSGSFKVHVDIPHNIIIQLEGKCRWTIYDEKYEIGRVDQNKLTPVIECLMEPGDVLFIPSKQAHLCVPISKRLSASIPFIPNSSERLTRGWINL
jgi:hypothetical protein